MASGHKNPPPPKKDSAMLYLFPFSKELSFPIPLGIPELCGGGT